MSKVSAQPVSGLPDSNSVSSTIPDLDTDAGTILKQIRINNLKNVIIGQLNINSLTH